MEVVYLNTNGFSGVSKKDSANVKNQDMAKCILDRLFEVTNPDILYFSEFDVHSAAGEYVFAYLAKKGYYRVYPNHWRWIGAGYNSIVIAFTKERMWSEPSPAGCLSLKWNEIVADGYRIVGVHIPYWEKREEDTRKFWDALTAHYNEHQGEKVLYIGDMNVFAEGTPGKIRLNHMLQTARDGWIEKGHSNDTAEAFTFIKNTRIDYAVLSRGMPKNYKMENLQEFMRNGWTDHSALAIEF